MTGEANAKAFFSAVAFFGLIGYLIYTFCRARISGSTNFVWGEFLDISPDDPPSYFAIYDIIVMGMAIGAFALFVVCCIGMMR